MVMMDIFNVTADAFDQSGWSEVFVDFDRDRGYRHLLHAGLDNGFKGVGILVEDIQFHRGIATEGPEAARGVRYVGMTDLSYHTATQTLQHLLGEREVLNHFDRSGTDDHVRLSIQYWLGQAGDVSGIVLIVGIRIDDYVGPLPYTCVQAQHKNLCQSLISGVTDDMINTVIDCDLAGCIRTAVINDQPFHLVEARHLSGQFRECEGQGFFFVITGDLYYQLHRIGTRIVSSMKNDLFQNGFEYQSPHSGNLTNSMNKIC